NYSGGNGEISSGDGLPKNYIQVENNAKFVMNNLTIIGNTTVPSINLGGTAEDILLQERLMSRNSGGYIGVFNTQGAVEINNSQIKFTVIAVSTRAKGFTLVNEEEVKISTVLNKVIIDDSWANGVYSHGADITI